MIIKCESGSSRFQPGEGPSRGLLRDYEPSDLLRIELFGALQLTPSAKCHGCIYLFPGPQWLTTAARRHQRGGDAGSHLWIHGKSLYWLSTLLSSLAFERNLNLWCDFNVDIHQIFMQDIIGAWLYPFLVSQRIQWDVPRVWHSATVKKCMRMRLTRL